MEKSRMVIYKSPIVDFNEDEIPEGSIFASVFGETLSPERGNKTALIDAQTEKSVTYSELRQLSLRLAEGLRQLLKLGKDGHPISGSQEEKPTVLTYCQNSIELVIVFLACQALTIPWSPANPAYTPEELAHQLSDTSASLIFATSEGNTLENAFKTIELINSRDSNHPILAGKFGRVWALPSHNGSLRNDVNGVGKIGTWEELLASEEKVTDETWVRLGKERSATELALLPYSSGTTGKPKGVRITHRNNNAVIKQLSSVPELFSPDDVSVNALPIFHIAGLNCVVGPLTLGILVVLIPRFDLELFCGAIQKYKATIQTLVPPMAVGLARAPVVSNYDLSSLKYILCGAAPLSAGMEVELANRLNEMRKGIKNTKPLSMIQIFGMTETSVCAAIVPPLLARPGSGACGPPLPGIHARLVRDDGTDVPPLQNGETESEPGELWVKGPNVMQGYHKNPTATRQTITSDGFLRTGDIAVIDKDGFLRIVDRVKELIKYSGFQVPPAELEALLLTCPLVADVAAVGVYSDERQTELPRAYVVLNEQGKLDPNPTHAIAEFVSARVAPHKRLRGGVVIVDVIPKSPSGKILRRLLRDRIVQEAKAKLLILTAYINHYDLLVHLSLLR